MAEETSLTLTEIESAIKRAMLNGESWRTGDIESRISLERLFELRDQYMSDDTGIVFNLAGFQTPTAEND